MDGSEQQKADFNPVEMPEQEEVEFIREHLQLAERHAAKAQQSDQKSRRHAMQAAMALQRLVEGPYRGQKMKLYKELKISIEKASNLLALADFYKEIDEAGMRELEREGRYLSLNQAAALKKATRDLDQENKRRLIQKAAQEDLGPEAIKTCAGPKGKEGPNLKEQLGITDDDVAAARAKAPQPPAVSVTLEDSGLVVRSSCPMTLPLLFAHLSKAEESHFVLQDGRPLLVRPNSKSVRITPKQKEEAA